MTTRLFSGWAIDAHRQVNQIRMVTGWEESQATRALRAWRDNPGDLPTFVAFLQAIAAGEARG